MKIITNSRIFITQIIVFFMSTLPYVVFAQDAGGVQNPLSAAYSNIPNFIEGFLKVMVQVGLPIVALFLLIAGFKFVAARGNAGKIEEAKANLVYVVIGAALILGAWVIATLIGNTVTDIVGK